MILDALLKVSAAQQVTADAVSGNTIDFGNVTPKRKVAVGEPLALVVCITAIGTNTGSAKVQAIQSAGADLSSPVIIGEVDLATADIKAGKVIVVPLGQGVPAMRYAGANYDITGTVDFTVDAYITPLSMASTLAETYAKNYTV
jgi:Bbp16